MVYITVNDLTQFNAVGAMQLPRFMTFVLVISCELYRAVAGPGAGLKTWERFSKLDYPGDKAFLYDTFPDNFMWAVGTAAYQVEGAFEKDGKGLSIWDTFTRGGNRIATGDVGSDSYHNIQSDVRALKQLGVSHYRFSLSWSRIFPNGSRGSYNEIGTNYYRTLIRKLKEINVQPVITLYHWDLPDNLQRTFGGWSDPALVELFRDYADFCFQTFGDDVKYWITIDNPFLVAWNGYGTGKVAPGIKNDPDLPFRVGHNLLKAHAAAWHLYDRHYRPQQQGKVSMALASHWIKPSRTRRESLQACQWSLDFVLGWFARPLFTDGDYPPSMKHNLSHRLPSFTQAERDEVRGTADFFALSHGPSLSYQLIDASLKFGQIEVLDLRMLLYWIRAEYDNPPIYIVESGWFVQGDIKTEDSKNMYYLKRFIMETLKSIKYDGVNVIGYTHWSLLDGFEWHREYDIRRGLYYVDFNTHNLKRRPKTSANFYKKLIQKNGFPQLPENRPAQGVFPCDFAWGVSANSIQVETTPTQFVDPSVYVWNITGNGELRRLEGFQAPPLRRPQHCADYATIRQQVEEIRRVGVNHFHFSLNWSSLVPSGNVTQPNTTLLGYYRCFTSQLHQANITSMVTLWHHTRQRSSLPAPMEAAGGWFNRDTVVAFADYARLCYRELGPHVKMWITLNEPNDEEDVSPMEGHQLLRAHALAWHAYDQEYRHTQGGQVSLALHMDWVEPAFSFSREDVEPANRVLDCRVGWFSEPIFGSGDYPPRMRNWFHQRHSLDLFHYHLPLFSDEDRQLVRGTYDFFAISHFSTQLVTPTIEENKLPSRLGVQYMGDITWIMSPRPNAPVVPWGLRKALNWVEERYRGVAVYVVANGVQEDPARFDDSLRVYYLYSYINEALKAYILDGVNLKGYFAYSLNDQRDPGFGLYGHVQDEEILKASLSQYQNIIRHNGFPLQGTPTSALQCPSQPLPCPGCLVLTKRPVVGFLSLVGSAVLVTLGLIIYYAAKRHIDRGRDTNGTIFSKI
ncbi:klotho [Salmo salar]|uniref:Klotho n=1 Tax=Salmo salar TaxID=8030 RepID=A0ABM3EQS4_SALSA|nr:klotho [Salmo salar]|eukprot:XP_014038320.1 PREDICTED: klotho [Salmo salar]